MNAIENFIRPKAIGLLKEWYDYDDLSLLLNGNEDEIRDSRYDAYINLTENDEFLSIKNLLLKREEDTATDIELAKLYKKLNET